MLNEYYWSRFLRFDSQKQLCFACSMQPTYRSNMLNGSPRGKNCSSGQCLKRTLSFVSGLYSATHTRKKAFILQRYHKVPYVKTTTPTVTYVKTIPLTVTYVKTIPLKESYLPLRQFRSQHYLRKTIRLQELLKVISLLGLVKLRQLRYHRLTDVKTIPLSQSY
jgi:hypothetical protein